MAKRQRKSFLEIIKFPNMSINLAATSGARLHDLSSVYKMIDTVELLRWFDKKQRYVIRNIVAGQPDTRYDKDRYKKESRYRDIIENKKRSKEHFVRISDAEQPHGNAMEILILNSHNGKCRLRIIMSITSHIAHEHHIFLSVNAIYGFAEIKHTDFVEKTNGVETEKKLDAVLEEFWATERLHAYELHELMKNEIAGDDLWFLAQEIATIKITKKSPTIDPKQIIDRMAGYKYQSYDALYHAAISTVKEVNMVRYIARQKTSIWGLQKEVKIAMLVLDPIKKHLMR